MCEKIEIHWRCWHRSTYKFCYRSQFHLWYLCQDAKRRAIDKSEFVLHYYWMMLVMTLPLTSQIVG